MIICTKTDVNNFEITMLCHSILTNKSWKRWRYFFAKKGCNYGMFSGRFKALI